MTYLLPPKTVGFAAMNDGVLSGASRIILRDELVQKIGGSRKRPLFRAQDGYMAYCNVEDASRA